MTTWDSTPQPLPPSPWHFPPPEKWPDDDLVAAGGDLHPGGLMAAYRAGLFPMGIDGDDILGWWSPDPRGVLPLDGLRVTRSMRQSAKRFQIRVDTAFREVMRGCAAPTRRGAWIDEHFIDAYTFLHERGWAHSVEAFDAGGRLAGGLYGIRIGRFFAGESMFHLQRDASKVALMGLVERMRASGMTLLDVQWQTEHLASLGVVAISRREYLRRLADAVR